MCAELALSEKAERLKLILIARATNGAADNEEYRKLRSDVVQFSSQSVPSLLRVCRSLDEFWAFIQPKFPSYAERRRFLRQEFEPLLMELEERELGGTPISRSEALAEFDSVHVRSAWETALSRLGSDPRGASTAAKSLLEAVCKHVLDEKGVSYGAREDLPSLYSRAAQELTISPSQQVDDTMRRMMGSAHQIVQNVAALRNLIGDAHGPGQDSPEAEPHHAELAVNLAGSLATFMIAALEVE